VKNSPNGLVNLAFGVINQVRVRDRVRVRVRVLIRLPIIVIEL
jgi:hypothetical protein